MALLMLDYSDLKQKSSGKVVRFIVDCIVRISNVDAFTELFATHCQANGQSLYKKQTSN